MSDEATKRWSDEGEDQGRVLPNPSSLRRSVASSLTPLSSTPFRAILFDLGDTLLDFEPMDTRAVFRLGAQRTYEYLQKKGCKLPDFERYCRSQHASVRWSYLWAKVCRREFNSLTLLRRMALKLHLQDNENILNRLAWLWYSPLCDYTSIEPDLLSTLTLLRSRGMRMGIVSNTFVPGEVLDKHLRLLGLIDFFPVRIYSSEVGYRKPDRRIFEQALRELRAKPEETLFIGDIVKTDIVGARRCGMRAALKQPWCSQGGPPTADYVISRISDVLEWIGTPAGPAASVQKPICDLRIPPAAPAA